MCETFIFYVFLLLCMLLFIMINNNSAHKAYIESGYDNYTYIDHIDDEDVEKIHKLVDTLDRYRYTDNDYIYELRYEYSIDYAVYIDNMYYLLSKHSHDMCKSYISGLINMEYYDMVINNRDRSKYIIIYESYKKKQIVSYIKFDDGVRNDTVMKYISVKM